MAAAGRVADGESCWEAKTQHKPGRRTAAMDSVAPSPRSLPSPRFVLVRVVAVVLVDAAASGRRHPALAHRRRGGSSSGGVCTDGQN